VGAWVHNTWIHPAGQWPMEPKVSVWVPKPKGFTQKSYLVKKKKKKRGKTIQTGFGTQSISRLPFKLLTRYYRSRKVF